MLNQTLRPTPHFESPRARAKAPVKDGLLQYAPPRRVPTAGTTPTSQQNLKNLENQSKALVHDTFAVFAFARRIRSRQADRTYLIPRSMQFGSEMPNTEEL